MLGTIIRTAPEQKKDEELASPIQQPKEPASNPAPTHSNEESSSSAVVTTTTNNKNHHSTFVGVRVHVKKQQQQQSDKNRCWGMIVRETVGTTYTVWFDDGDVVEGISGYDIRTEADCVNVPSRPPHLREYQLDANGDIIFQKKMLTAAPSVAASAPIPASTEGSWTPQRLFLEACGKCWYCTRPSCETCASCQSNIGSDLAPRACFRKVRTV